MSERTVDVGDLPQAERVLTWIRCQDAPLVILAGWPGSAQRQLVAKFGAAEGAAVLTVEEWLDAGRRRRGTEQARDSGWIVLPAAVAAFEKFSHQLAMVLPPGVRVVLDDAVDPHCVGSFDVAVAAHDVLALDFPEALSLARATGGRGNSSSSPQGTDEPDQVSEWAVDLWQWAQGWYEPLRLVLRPEAAASRTERSFFAAPGMRSFFEDRLWRSLSEEDRRVLMTAALEERLSEEPFGPLVLKGPIEQAGSSEHQPGGGITSSDAFSRIVRLDSNNRLRAPRPWVEFVRRKTEVAPVPWAGAVAGSVDGSAADAVPNTGQGQRPLDTQARAPLTGTLRREESWGFQLRLLGVIELDRMSSDGPSPLVWPYRAVALLLAYLATRRERSASREELLANVWPEDEDRDVSTLHPAISHLRRLLRTPDRKPGGAVVRKAGHYRLANDWPLRVDVDDFVAVADDRATVPVADLERAWRSYRGPFLRGFDAPWIEDLRTDLRRKQQRLLRRIAENYRQQGAIGAAEDALRAALAEDPAQEDIHLDVMRLLAQRGRPDLVRRQFDQLCRVLFEEIRRRPSDDTVREYHVLIR